MSNPLKGQFRKRFFCAYSCMHTYWWIVQYTFFLLLSMNNKQKALFALKPKKPTKCLTLNGTKTIQMILASIQPITSTTAIVIAAAVAFISIIIFNFTTLWLLQIYSIYSIHQRHNWNFISFSLKRGEKINAVITFILLLLLGIFLF